MILVGTLVDINEEEKRNNEKSWISKIEAKVLARKLNALDYCEIYLKSFESVENFYKRVALLGASNSN